MGDSGLSGCDDAACVRADVTERAAALAHDFSNVVLAIRGYAELIVRDQTASRTVQEIAVEIAGACERAFALTRRLDTLAADRPVGAGVKHAA